MRKLNDNSQIVCVLFIYSDMIPLPYVTKDNYKVLLYRLADTQADKVCLYTCSSSCNDAT